MFIHATIPGLPERLWQAAFLLDMLRHDPTRSYNDETYSMAGWLDRQSQEVIAWRKKKLGW
jgi:hypothetical protein